VHCASRLFLPPYPSLRWCSRHCAVRWSFAALVQCARTGSVRGPCAVRFVPTALAQCTYTWPWRML